MALAKYILSSGFVRLWFNAEMFFFICAKQKSWSLGRILHFNVVLVCVMHVIAGAQVGATGCPLSGDSFWELGLPSFATSGD